MPKNRLIGWFGNLLVISGLIYLFLGFYPVIKAEFLYRTFYVREKFTPSPSLSSEEKSNPLLENLTESPVNFTGVIMIPKLNINTPIIWDVSVTDPSAYLEALKLGVAHAENTHHPDVGIGNTYLFAHSTVNFWEITKYSSVFTLLNKLEPNDEVIIFYNNQRFNYQVVGNEVTGSFDLKPLTRKVDKSTLTLQTCDPPGIPINRRIVTAELKNVITQQSVNGESAGNMYSYDLPLPSQLTQPAVTEN